MPKAQVLQEFYNYPHRKHHPLCVFKTHKPQAVNQHKNDDEDDEGDGDDDVMDGG